MAKKPQTSSPKSKPKSRAGAKSSTATEAVSVTETHIESPLTARERVFSIACLIVEEAKIDPDNREIWAIVEEQFIHPDARTHNRYLRKADEMLCQRLERDPRFQEAVAIAKGQVWG